MNKKILALSLPLLFLSLIAIPAGNAVVTPVEVERVKGVCFFRMRGDPQTTEFLLHYKNIAPTSELVQAVEVDGSFISPTGRIYDYGTIFSFAVGTGGSVEKSTSEITIPMPKLDKGWIFSFEIRVNLATVASDEQVVIPPP
jgi:hypothetical protein